MHTLAASRTQVACRTPCGIIGGHRLSTHGSTSTPATDHHPHPHGLDTRPGSGADCWHSPCQRVRKELARTATVLVKSLLELYGLELYYGVVGTSSVSRIVTNGSDKPLLSQAWRPAASFTITYSSPSTSGLYDCAAAMLGLEDPRPGGRPTAAPRCTKALTFRHPCDPASNPDRIPYEHVIYFMVPNGCAQVSFVASIQHEDSRMQYACLSPSSPLLVLCAAPTTRFRKGCKAATL